MVPPQPPRCTGGGSVTGQPDRTAHHPAPTFGDDHPRPAIGPRTAMRKEIMAARLNDCQRGPSRTGNWLVTTRGGGDRHERDYLTIEPVQPEGLAMNQPA